MGIIAPLVIIFLGYYAAENQINELEWWERDKRTFNEDSFVITIFPSYEETLQKMYVKYAIVDDVFLNTKVINWKSSYILFDDDRKPSLRCSFEGGSDKAFLILQYWDFHQFKYFDIKCISDLHFLFDENTILSFKVDRKTTKYEKNECASFRIIFTNDLIKCLDNSLLKQIRIDTTHKEHCDFIIEESRSIDFQYVVKCFASALSECGYELQQNETAHASEASLSEDNSTNNNDKCHVYLMCDESNGFYKIGISNNPEYREHTLQSEKPTIVLVCSKVFPNRLIAEAIESALHKAYGDKRLRGEWFRLTASDVKDLKATLS